MRDILLTCPLCCDKVFNSKEALVEHLANVFANINCPICEIKLSSLELLIEHLNLNKCEIDNTVETIVFEDSIHTENQADEESLTEKVNQSYIGDINEKATNEGQFSAYHHSPDSQDAHDEHNEVGKMYVELLSKQLMKPCLQTQELKLVKEHGESRYMILDVTKDDFILKTGSTVVTKQNSDGTISLTTVKDSKIELDPLITSNNEIEDNQEEIYSCNTCGVSFSSVIEHIQNYHNDQDVVVEEPMEAMEENDYDADVIKLESLEAEETVTDDKQAPRRVITDTGDIVEAPVIVKNTSQLNDETIVPNNLNNVDTPLKEGCKRNRSHSKRYVQIDKFCDSVVTDIKSTEEKKGPYHKVVVKEMQTLDGGNKVKVYNCVRCNIYVTALDDFKSHPCKMPKYSCPHCPVTYENSKSLCAHMKVHKVHLEGDTEIPGPFKCETCCTVFPTNKSLKLHKRMHDPVKSRPIEPPVENLEGTEVSSDKYLCEICDILIPIDYKTVHQKSHESTDKYNCEICNRKFHSNEYLEMHMSIHNLDKVPVNKQDKTLPYTCLYCNRQFARPHEKVKHERIHTGEKPHRCEICGKSFRVSYCLTLHMRTHTGARPYACPHCGKRFKAHSVYNHHLLTHSEVRAYKCPFCPKAFKTSVQLAGHKNSHTKPFSCQHCNRPFASLYAVRVHTETHARQNNLKFSCSLCGASYARTFALKDHIKQVHKQDVENADNLADIKDWMVSDGDPDAIQPLSKDLQEEVQ